MLITIVNAASEYWYIFLLLAVVVYAFAKNESVVLDLARVLARSTYFRAVVVLTLLSLGGYFLAKDSWPNLEILKLGNYIQFVTLIFAVVAVYFAFAQLSHARYESLVQKANACLLSNQFPRAADYFEQAIVYEKDYEVYANLAELYLILGKIKKFEIIRHEFKKVSMGEYEEIIGRYLTVLEGFTKGDKGLAESALREMISFCQTHQIGMQSFRSWRFEQMDTVKENFSLEFQALYNEMKEYVKANDKARSQQIVEKYLNIRPTAPIIS